jgi:hypothetical protein
MYFTEAAFLSFAQSTARILQLKGSVLYSRQSGWGVQSKKKIHLSYHSHFDELNDRRQTSVTKNLMPIFIIKENEYYLNDFKADINLTII